MSYNAYMKVWRGFTLTVWVIVLTLMAGFFMQYRALQTSVLDAQTVKTELAKSGIYEELRDTILLDKLTTNAAERYPGSSTIVDAPLLRSVLSEALPADEVKKRVEPAVDALYRWLDSKEPEISFSIDLSDRTEVFYRALEVQLGKKVAALPSCGDYRYPPEDAVLVDGCLPVYVTAEEATAAAMATVKSSELPIGNTLTPETFTVPKEQIGGLKQIPTYLNYLWVLNFVAVAIFALISILLLVTRKAVGLVAIGVSLVMASLSVWLTIPLVKSFKTPTADGVMSLVSSLTGSFINAFVTASSRYALIGFLIGLTLIGLAGGWRWWRKRRTHA